MSGHTSIPDVPLCLSAPFDIGGAVDVAIKLLFSKSPFQASDAFLSAESHKRSLFQSQLGSQEDHKRYMLSGKRLSPTAMKGKKSQLLFLISSNISEFIEMVKS